ncbi:uncharacterized protein PAC_13858 [Phialocephala subalpina]|uniref:Ubiquitin-like domain-containing protein n=1 Tax=Phialocephala subalpina TaxID=576137 RepID=A0A1L7XFZ6_9HELO|nr:uncharacterized protein PAC_13858 [Phialocephala subalpina]
MSGITFGSVGDIIAVGQIALALAKALSDSRGSAKEYQDLVKELQAFEQALLQVLTLWQSYEDSPELKELGTTTINIVNDWREILLAFRLKVDNKYGTSLCAGGSAQWLKDVTKKVLWQKEKEEILELRRKLQMASHTIAMLCLTAIGKSVKLDSSAQKVRVELVHGLLHESIKRTEEQLIQLKTMDEKLVCQDEVSNMILSTVKSGMTYLLQVHTIVIDIRAMLSLLRNQIPRGLGTHWQQEPVTLEDALGFRVPIPLELVDSWEMFDTILSKRFEKHPGHKKVQSGEYVIEDGISGHELDRMLELVSCLRPGQKIEMCITFAEANIESNTCPRCQTESVGSAGSRIQCQNPSCKMWFQRIVTADDQHFVEGPSEQTISNGGWHNVISTSVPTESSIHPRLFQRVRLLQKESLLTDLPYSPSPCYMCYSLLGSKGGNRPLFIRGQLIKVKPLFTILLTTGMFTS